MNAMIVPTVRSNFEGYNDLINLIHLINQQSEKEIILDFKENGWFEANLSAVLGGLQEVLTEQSKTLKLINLNSILEDVFKRNLFLKEFGHIPIPDEKNTVLSYRKFTKYQDIEFINYISRELLTKPDFPKHSEMLGKKINESIFELFENARSHGECKYIFTCGQYYPMKNKKRLDITIVDFGNTIKTNVNNYLKTFLSGSDAISWAMIDGNTTRKEDKPGGLGLSIIFEFIALNKGKIQIVSSDGYYEFNKGNTEFRNFHNTFPGTIVNIEFNLNDTNSYRLKEEISLDSIF